MRAISILLFGMLLVACNGNSSGQWHHVSSTEQGQLAKAKAICRGRASETQVAAGRLWILGAVEADSSFKGCMAEQGYVQ
jgi:hypothetical protein